MNEDPVLYDYRPSALEKKRTFTLLNSSLMIEQGDHKQSVKYDEIESIRLFYDPDRYNPNKYGCKITDTKGGSVQLKNIHFQSVGKFEDRSESYIFFIVNLHKNLRYNDHVVYLSGNKTGCFIGNIVSIILSIMALSMAWWYWGFSMEPIILLRIFLFFGLLVLGARYIRKNSPTKYDPAQIPESVIPKISDNL